MRSGYLELEPASLGYEPPAKGHFSPHMPTRCGQIVIVITPCALNNMRTGTTSTHLLPAESGPRFFRSDLFLDGWRVAVTRMLVKEINQPYATFCTRWEGPLRGRGNGPAQAARLARGARIRVCPRVRRPGFRRQGREMAAATALQARQFCTKGRRSRFPFGMP